MEDGFDYVSLRAAVFMKKADTSRWRTRDWDALYEDIASWEQLTQCVCGNCPDKLPSNRMS